MAIAFFSDLRSFSCSAAIRTDCSGFSVHVGQTFANPVLFGISSNSSLHCLHVGIRYLHYFAVFFCAAQRFFCAAAMRALPSGLILLFFLDLGAAAIDFAGRPGPFLIMSAEVESRSARACFSDAISASIRERMSVVFMGNIVTHRLIHDVYFLASPCSKELYAVRVRRFKENNC